MIDAKKPVISVLSDKHSREHFDCGNTALNKYIKTSVDRDINNRLTRCYVLSSCRSSKVKGFYTLSNHAVTIADLPKKFARKMPPGYLIPTILLGRLAVDTKFRGNGFGEFMLIDSMRRSLSAAEISNAFAMVVQYKDKNAKSYYKKFGFIPFTGKDLSMMFLPLKTIAGLFE